MQWVSWKVSDAQGVTLTLCSYFDEQKKNEIHLPCFYIVFFFILCDDLVYIL